MPARRRVLVLVAAAAAAAAAVTVAVTVLTSGSGDGGARAAPPARANRPGVPPLLIDLGVRTDPQARALRRAATLYTHGRRAAAGAIFDRYRSLEARVGSALSRWPAGAGALARLAARHPRSSVVQLHEGLALYWLGRTAEARAAWLRAKRSDPDTSYAVRAADLLHPELPIPGLPFFVPTFPSPPQLDRLSAPRQLAFLAARARNGGVRDRLLYGSALQRLGRPLSAEREFRSAAALAPGDAQAQVAAAVGLFDKDAPQRAFGRLGPLTHTFPRAATVRFHLGILLLWLGQVRQAERELRLARADAPRSKLGREADRFLARLVGVGAGSGGR